MSESVIEFVASVAKVQTMADGGLRFIFDAPETAVMQAAQLMECKRFGAVLVIRCTPAEEGLINKGNKNGSAKGTNEQSQWATP